MMRSLKKHCANIVKPFPPAAEGGEFLIQVEIIVGDKMENVIFNGTKRRKPLGMAEVHMTLSNEDRTLPIDYSEITIARKLYRNGTSEYYVNGDLLKQPDLARTLERIANEGYLRTADERRSLLGFSSLQPSVCSLNRPRRPFNHRKQ